MIVNTHYPFTRKKVPPEPEWTPVPSNGIVFTAGRNSLEDGIIADGITRGGDLKLSQYLTMAQYGKTGSLNGVVFGKNTTTITITTPAYASRLPAQVYIDDVEQERIVDGKNLTINIAEFATNSAHTISFKSSLTAPCEISSITFNV